MHVATLLTPEHLAIAIFAISVSYAEAADRQVETATLGTYANSEEPGGLHRVKLTLRSAE
ncbi:hypothetical protein [Mesorhizobium sp.]|uniref:hypothetical protein n=1 Tax=Mesorhizobium sp. TaxID=1871066 RepID=UPI000FE603A0|nr:hypothetical protein [Mesorhizobium sp.]RWO52599.1 MAG: hypothetical protein EOS14_34300 [Mesorhizobium sp.]